MDVTNNPYIPLLPSLDEPDELDQLISIHPLQLQFPFKLNKPVSSSFQLSNKSDKHVAFRVKTNNLKKYTVRPTKGIVLPRSRTNVTVKMQALKEEPSDLRCNDKFLVQSVAVSSAATLKDITPETFKKEAGNHVEECKLSADYYDIPTESEESEEETSENAIAANDLLSTLNKEKQALIQENKRLLQILVEAATLTKEVQSIIQESIKLVQELKLSREGRRGNNGVGSLVVVVVLLIVVLGILLWHNI